MRTGLPGAGRGAGLKTGLYVRAVAAMALLYVAAGLQTGPFQTGQLTAPLFAQTNNSQRHGRLFRPQDLALLEEPDRAQWQKPDQIMDALAIADGSKVADVGIGAGFFTVRLARRVGPGGIVYAQDIQPEMIDATRRRVAREGLRNVQVRLGKGNDPNLPKGVLDAVLVVDVYPEVDDRLVFLRNLKESIKPTGRIGVVNFKPGGGGPGPSPNEGVRVDADSVEADARAAGLRVLSRENLPFQYLLVLGK